MRTGLFEATKRIGGDSAEKILLETLSTTGRGVEVAYLAYALQEMAPNKYREAALSAAHDLLARPIVKGSANNLDKNERDFLYGVLNYFNDGSYLDVARRELIKPDGKVDSVAVRYIQQTLGEKSVAFAAQTLQDPRIAADQREPFARVALNYTGIYPQADQLWRNTVTDMSVPEEHRKNLIEDLNEVGFNDPQHITPSDLPLIEKRLNILEDLAKNTSDPANLAAIKEAYKDLAGMRGALQPKQ